MKLCNASPLAAAGDVCFAPNEDEVPGLELDAIEYPPADEPADVPGGSWGVAIAGQPWRAGPRCIIANCWASR